MSRILVVDDIEPILRFAELALTRAGHEVVTADGVEAAMSQLGPDVDLLLTDVRLGDGNGIALSRMALARHPGLRIVYMTGSATDEIVHAAMHWRVLMKPFASRELQAAISEVLAETTAA